MFAVLVRSDRRMMPQQVYRPTIPDASESGNPASAGVESA